MSFPGKTLLLLVGLLSPLLSQAAPAPSPVMLDNGISSTNVRSTLAMIELHIASIRPGMDTSNYSQDLTRIRQLARTCIHSRMSQQEKLTQDLNLLGDSSEDEAEEISAAREALIIDKTTLDREIAECRLMLVKSEKLLERLRLQLEQELRQHLFAHDTSVLDILEGKTGAGQGWWRLFQPRQEQSPPPATFSLLHWLSLAMTLVAAAAMSTFMIRMARRYQQRPVHPGGFTDSMMMSIASTSLRYGVMLLTIGAVAAFLTGVAIQQGQFNSLAGMAIVLFAYLLIIAVGRALLKPIPPASHYLPLPEDTCRHYWTSLRLLASIIALTAFLYYMPFIHQLPAMVITLSRLIFVTLVVVALAGVIWNFFALYGRPGLRLGRMLLILVLLSALFAEYSGYQNLAEYLITGIFFSLILIGLAWLITVIGNDMLDSLEEGRYDWQRGLQRHLGVQHLPGLFWFRILLNLLAWGGLVYYLINVWDISGTRQAELLAYINEGFHIGSVQIIPLRILISLIMIAALMSLISWMRKQLEEQWLRKSRMDYGARIAVASTTAYAMGGLAIIAALGVAGVDFGNLAIIAGALSVGIGFGLQNIVNNFVSGLILLFERPVQKGDWIVVGSTEGYVRKISIRSTQIQTFDRADIIVPNSDLISNQVTNWTLRDLSGRVRIPIGVAYGSDLQTVKEVLVQIAQEQPGAILNNPDLKPKCLFLGFGDSSLNFELRFFIRNVDERLNVISDVNFLIDARFREHNIEIPFPQRVVHLSDRGRKEDD